MQTDDIALQKTRGDMMEMSKHLRSTKKQFAPVIPNQRPVRNGKHRYQLYQKRSRDGEN